MEAKDIKTQFTKHIKNSMKSEKPRYNLWYCGITNNEIRRKAEHSRKDVPVKFWKCLRARNMEEANQVESYFNKMGTSNRYSKNGAVKGSVYTYIFKKYTQKIKGLNGPSDSYDSILKDFFELKS